MIESETSKGAVKVARSTTLGAASRADEGHDSGHAVGRAAAHDSARAAGHDAAHDSARAAAHTAGHAASAGQTVSHAHGLGQDAAGHDDHDDHDGRAYHPVRENSPLARFSIAMPEELLMRFDELVARRGVAKNRSEVVRDLVRDALIKEEADVVGAEVMGTLTIVFDHHASDVQETLHMIQHAHYGLVVSTTHVHLDERSCLEVIILRGETTEVRHVSDQILGTKGVKNGGLVLTTTGQMI